MYILVAGGFDTDDAAMKERVGAFCTALGKAVSKHGHVLLNACRTELDKLIAEATYADVVAAGDPDPDKRVISYLLSGVDPLHEVGTIIRSRLTDWDIKGEAFFVPEQIQQADVVILVGGFDGTFRAANWARIAGKPLLPFTAFGGAAEKIYAQEVNEFATKYAGRVERLEYEQLNSVKSDWDDRATDLVALAEKIGESRSVAIVMSYSGDDSIEDACYTFEEVCEDLGFQAARVTQANAGERILPDILSRIDHAAFTIVDLTDLRPNVFYELGYADGLGKKVILTARAGTELPFDVKDMPTILWKSQKQLREELRQRIITVVKPASANASPPLGNA
jgi:nucleoside 2-deoxyribosyltransferase